MWVYLVTSHVNKHNLELPLVTSYVNKPNFPLPPLALRRQTLPPRQYGARS